jgi:hypothetical protein
MPDAAKIPEAALVNGETYGWFVRALSRQIIGPTSDGMAFLLQLPLTGVAEQIGPRGNVRAAQLEFQWRPVQGATIYYVLLLDARGTEIKDIGGVGTFVPAEQLCKAEADGSVICRLKPDRPPQNGVYNWFVVAANAAGQTDASAGLNMRVTR